MRFQKNTIFGLTLNVLSQSAVAFLPLYPSQPLLTNFQPVSVKVTSKLTLKKEFRPSKQYHLVVEIREAKFNFLSLDFNVLKRSSLFLAVKSSFFCAIILRVSCNGIHKRSVYLLKVVDLDMRYNTIRGNLSKTNF